MAVPAAREMDRAQFMPLEAVATWLLPGLGHILVGQKKRGVILMAAIGSLWLAGLVIGGIASLERREPTLVERLRFTAQALVAPTLPVDLWRASLGARTVPLPDANPGYQPSLGRSSEVGVLATTVAGLLNLLAIIDVGYCDLQRRKQVAVEEKTD